MLVKVCFQMFFSWKGYLPYFPQVSLFGSRSIFFLALETICQSFISLQIRRCFCEYRNPGLVKVRDFYILFIRLDILKVLIIQPHQQAFSFIIHFEPTIHGILIKSNLSLFKKEGFGTEKYPPVLYLVFDSYLVIIQRCQSIL